jgi:hypothetical protein
MGFKTSTLWLLIGFPGYQPPSWVLSLPHTQVQSNGFMSRKYIVFQEIPRIYWLALRNKGSQIFYYSTIPYQSWSNFNSRHSCETSHKEAGTEILNMGLLHLLSMKIWANYSLSLSVFVYKMGMMVEDLPGVFWGSFVFLHLRRAQSCAPLWVGTMQIFISCQWFQYLEIPDPLGATCSIREVFLRARQSYALPCVPEDFLVFMASGLLHK